MSKQKPCPDCQSKGIFSFMLYSRKLEYYICPNCSGSFIPAEKDDHYIRSIHNDEIKMLMCEMYKSNLPPKDPIPAGQALKGTGSSKTKGQSKKGLMKKKSVNQLYKEL